LREKLLDIVPFKPHHGGNHDWLKGSHVCLNGSCLTEGPSY